MLTILRPFHRIPLIRLRCMSSSLDSGRYKEAFARRMAMAGLKPHHRIALAVSGGPDSMALCVLTAGWKMGGLVGRDEGSVFIDGLLGIVVDHGLRAESAEEARLVRDWVSKMGIECEIKCCDWSEGRPKLGHLQETAREKRYEIFQDVCIEKQIGVLLVAHHADDQAELLILRISRNSGVLGLAGMAFMTQIFPTNLDYHGGNLGTHGILLVRPMLEFAKDDMYMICQCANQQFVEDPTNQSKNFARNRIRMSLRKIPSCSFKAEMQMLISTCRLTRSFVENFCLELINESVTVMDHGYAIIDLGKLEPSNVEDLYLSKLLALTLQFISQRHRPVRGGIMQLLLDYIRNIPCKTSLTAAGCYISPAPQSKGMKVLVSCSVDSPQSSSRSLSCTFPSCKEQPLLATEVDEIISDMKLYSHQQVSEHSKVLFLHAKSSEAILSEAKKLNIISESTYRSIISLQSEEAKNFNANAEVANAQVSKSKMGIPSLIKVKLHPGQSCHFMSRFLVTWNYPKGSAARENSSRFCGSDSSPKDNGHHDCLFCRTDQEKVLEIRYMVDADWMYLSELKGDNELVDPQQYIDSSTCKLVQAEVAKDPPGYMQLSAQSALKALKSIPLPARRALPVLVDSNGSLLSIPSIGFQCCPCFSIAVLFKPSHPLGGGYTSYV